MSQQLFKNSCWTCKRALEDPQEKYTCPKLEQHWEDYSKLERNRW